MRDVIVLICLFQRKMGWIEGSLGVLLFDWLYLNWKGILSGQVVFCLHIWTSLQDLEMRGWFLNAHSRWWSIAERLIGMQFTSKSVTALRVFHMRK